MEKAEAREKERLKDEARKVSVFLAKYDSHSLRQQGVWASFAHPKPQKHFVKYILTLMLMETNLTNACCL